MSEINCVFGVTLSSFEKVTSDIVDLFKNSYDGYLEPSFSKIKSDSTRRKYQIYDDKMDLSGVNDLVKRLEINNGGEFCFEVDMGFYCSDIYVALCKNDISKDELTVFMTFDKLCTDYLMDSIEPREPFAMVLVNIAKNIGSNCFIAGLNIDSWIPLFSKDLLDKNRYGKSPLIVGWRYLDTDSENIASVLEIPPSDINDMHDDFRVALLFKV